ncbi:MAG: two-component regulator propeller domain-containing protein, partial [Flavobacteriaceae bacterium]
RKERLWIGTRNGISLRGPENTFQQYYSGGGTRPKKTLGIIRQIYEDSKGRIWVADHKKGLFRLNEGTGFFERIEFLSNAEDIPAMIEDAEGRLWVSLWERGVYLLDAASGNIIKRFEEDKSEQHLLTSNTIFLMFKDSKGQIWLGDPRDNDQGLFKYVEEKEQFQQYRFKGQDTLSLSSNEIRLITEDDLGRIWVGTDGGLNLYDDAQDNFLRNKDLISLPSISNFARDINGKMWFTSYSGGGLALVGPGVNETEMFGEDTGLLHNDILVNRIGLLMDDFGKLWLPTERGLSIFDIGNKTFSSYFKKDGFQDYGGIRTTLKTHDGDLWIGGVEGINHIIPGKLAVKDSTLPSLVITRMGIMDSIYSAADGDLFDKSVPYTDHVTLAHTQRDLSFEFVALHYLRPEDNLYSWKLEPYDNEWSEPSKERRAAYTNLSPGEYTFRVKGSNADGVWNEEGAAITVIIAPPWWLTWWAYGLYTLLAAYIGYRIHLAQKKRTIRKEREKAREKELEQAKEIEKAYGELKATQTQLIQSEKMASLGEL